MYSIAVFYYIQLIIQYFHYEFYFCSCCIYFNKLLYLLEYLLLCLQSFHSIQDRTQIRLLQIDTFSVVFLSLLGRLSISSENVSNGAQLLSRFAALHWQGTFVMALNMLYWNSLSIPRQQPHASAHCSPIDSHDALRIILLGLCYGFSNASSW